MQLDAGEMDAAYEHDMENYSIGNKVFLLNFYRNEERNIGEIIYCSFNELRFPNLNLFVVQIIIQPTFIRTLGYQCGTTEKCN